MLFVLYILAVISIQYAHTEEIPSAIVQAIYTGNNRKETPNSIKWQSQPVTTCKTESCINTASEISTYLNKSVDPCENFYEFACGNYLKKMKIPEGRNNFDLFVAVDEIILEKLRSILNEPLQPNEPRPFQLAKYFYLSCLNEKIIEERGLRPLVDIFELFGGWPVVKRGKWIDDKFSWIEALKNLRRLGFNTAAIFDVFVDTDSKNSSKRILYVSCAKNKIQEKN